MFPLHLIGQKALLAGIASDPGGAYRSNDDIPHYLVAQTDDAKVTILSLIGSGGSEHLVQRALDMIFTERVRAQDAPSIFVSCSANPIGRDLTWRFTQVCNASSVQLVWGR